MIQSSLKQLFRTPIKALLFFLLVMACTLLMAFGSVLLLDSNQRIAAAEQEFSTIGMVEQPPVYTQTKMALVECWKHTSKWEDEIYEDVVSVNALDFEGAEYVFPPEDRPYYITINSELNSIGYMPRVSYSYYDIVEFTALEDGDSSGPAQVRIEKVLFHSRESEENYQQLTSLASQLDQPLYLEEGKTAFLSQSTFNAVGRQISWTKGKRYIAAVSPYPYVSCPTHSDIFEFELRTAPCSTQYTPEGKPVETSYFPVDENGRPNRYRVDEVTDGFYEEGGLGQAWLNAIEVQKAYGHDFFVTSTNSLQMIPVFHEKDAFVQEGREITEKEFETGARVCMLSQNLANANMLKTGDKITLPLFCSFHGYRYDNSLGCLPNTDMMNAEGKLYAPFWTAEYEIVGTFGLTTETPYTMGELPRDLFIIPSRSVGASDENNIAAMGPMHKYRTSFMIPNGTIDEFDQALRAAVPEAESLHITYDDNGYTEVIQSLRSARLAAILLFSAGLLAALAVVILLLYFFVVKQKKRTAVERSLGMTKRQCRVSLLAGLLIMTAAAAMIGSGAGAALLRQEAAKPEPPVSEAVEAGAGETAVRETESMETETLYGFSTEYSPWWQDNGARQAKQAIEGTAFHVTPYLVIPAVLTLLIFLLALFLTNQNLKTEPILLLNTKTE